MKWFDHPEQTVLAAIPVVFGLKAARRATYYPDFILLRERYRIMQPFSSRRIKVREIPCRAAP